MGRLRNDGRWSRALNLASLVAGFGLGQGSIFVAQTWLVAGGELVLLAAFGTHFMLATLGTLLVDAGGITVLARHVAHLSSGKTSRADISKVFWETTLFRLVLALIAVFGGAAYAMIMSAETFSRSYMLLAGPGLLLWAGNAAGMLDGLKLSGISGLTGSITYVVSALTLIPAEHASPAVAGAMLGAAFSIGNLTTLIAQWTVLNRHGLRLGPPKVSHDGLVRSAKDGFSMLGGLLPGQLSFRFQLLLSSTFLGAPATALLLYSKQIISGMTQIIGFVLRVEFPGLVQIFSQPGKQTLATIFGAQKLTTFLAVGLTIAALGVGTLMTLAPKENFSRIGLLVVAFSPTVLTISIMWIMAQGLAALSRYATMAAIIAIFVTVGMVVSYLCLATYGVYAFIVGDLASHATGLLLLYFSLRGQRHPDPQVVAQEP